MAYITNRARGPRVVWIAGANGPVGRTIMPGETVSEVELHNANDPVTAAWVKAGELVVSATEPGAPGANQPTQEELMAAWRDRQGVAALNDRIRVLEDENRRLREAAQGSNQAPAGGQQGGQGNDGDSIEDPEIEQLSDDELRAYLTARGVTPGNWQRKRLLAEAETVKGVKPGEAA